MARSVLVLVLEGIVLLWVDSDGLDGAGKNRRAPDGSQSSLHSSRSDAEAKSDVSDIWGIQPDDRHLAKQEDPDSLVSARERKNLEQEGNEILLVDRH